MAIPKPINGVLQWRHRHNRAPLPSAISQHHWHCKHSTQRRCAVAAAAATVTAALMSIKSARIAAGGASDNCSVADVAVTIPARVVGGVGDSW